ncbi:MAG: hypothetical protein OXG97_03330 [Candidatus Poribacteria bacterium]|nr:hypothetical protein [Candidatus Poribacteria bacterium]
MKKCDCRRYSLFPSESTRKSIVLTEWQKWTEDRGVRHQDPTEADLEYLKSQGIPITGRMQKVSLSCSMVFSCVNIGVAVESCDGNPNESLYASA